MQKIEDAVGEHDATALGRAPARRVGPVVDLCRRDHAARPRRSKDAFGVRVEADFAHEERQLDVLVVLRLDLDVAARRAEA